MLTIRPTTPLYGALTPQPARPKFSSATLSESASTATIPKTALETPLSPKPDRLMVAMARIPIQHLLHSRRGIVDIQVEGTENYHQAVREGYHVMLTPNHRGDGDLPMIFGLSGELGKPFCILTDQHNFNQVSVVPKELRATIYQRLGLIPVNGRVDNAKAMGVVEDTLVKGRNPTVVFPEGRQTFTNDLIQELQHGAASISLKAGARKTKVAILPVITKYHYLDDITPGITRHLEQLEKALGMAPSSISLIKDNPGEIANRIHTVWTDLLAAREKILLQTNAPTGEGLGIRQQRLTKRLYDSVAADLGISYPSHSTPLEKIKLILKTIDAGLPNRSDLDADAKRQLIQQKITPKREALYQLSLLPVNYLENAATQERLVEVMHHLEVLQYGRSSIMKGIGRRQATIHIGKPILLDPFLATYAADKRGTTNRLTQHLQSQMQQVLDGLAKADLKRRIA
jgi:1-acyl-sn-glycerol-3-phosphate acyltransferase